MALVILRERREAAPAGLPLTVTASGESLATGEWFTATEERRRLLLSDLGDLTLAPGSRLHVRRLAVDETRLYLERGALDALVSIRARPRFFQVETPATTCIDLGCRYTLTVDDAGVAQVHVKTGRVVFESHGREVFVPAGATCRARPDTGPGTPRFVEGSPELASALDAFDAAPPAGVEARRYLARKALALASDESHTLPVWHFLQDADAEIACAARDALVRVVVTKEEPPPPTPGKPDTTERERWKAILESTWW
jgi:hypothetical protein